MRRFSAVLGGLLAVGALQGAVSPSALAAPGSVPCATDAARGAVSAAFVLDACVESAAVTLRNTLRLPVVVQASGDVGAPQVVDADDSPAAAVLRAVSGPGTLLMPGDEVRWPLGPAPADLAVTLLPTGAEPIARALGPVLPEGDEAVPAESVTALVGAAAAAIEERMACGTGNNFLRVAACDVVATTTIGSALAAHLPREAALEVQPVLVAARHWTAWAAETAADLRVVEGRELRLVQGAVAPEPPVVAPEPVPARPAPARPAPARPAPLPAVVAPAPVPLPDPAPDPVPDPVPVPDPGPVPDPDPVPDPGPAPEPEPPVVGAPGTDARQWFELWLRDLANRLQQG